MTDKDEPKLIVPPVLTLKKVLIGINHNTLLKLSEKFATLADLLTDIVTDPDMKDLDLKIQVKKDSIPKEYQAEKDSILNVAFSIFMENN